MAVLHAAQRNELDGEDFAVPGKRKLPMHDKTHAVLAWRMVDRTDGLTDAERATARSRIKTRLTRLGVDISNYDEANSNGIIPSAFPVQYLSTALSFLADLQPDEAFALTGEVMSALGDAMVMSLRSLQVVADAPKNIAVCFSDGAEVVEDGEKRKVRLPMARLGTYVHPKYGIVQFTQRDYDDIMRNFADGEAGHRPWLRYGHAKFPEANDAEPAIAFLERIEQDGDILWGIFDPIKPEVVDQVELGEYAHGSAELRRQAISKRDGRPIGTLLTAHALTNAPFIPDLPFNQVLSDAASSPDRYMTLSLSSRGDCPMLNPDQVLSAIDEQLGETLSITVEQRNALREKLSSMMGEKKPDEACGDAGAADDQGGTTQVTEALANTPDEPGKTAEGADDANKPDAGDEAEAIDALGGNRMEKVKGGAGDHGTPEQNSDSGEEDLSHGDPLRKAADAMNEMAAKEDNEEAKEKFSAVGQFLSMLGGWVGFGKKAGGSAEDPTDPQNSDQIPQDPAGTVVDNSSGTQALSEGDSTMTKEEIEALVGAALTQQAATFEQKLSDAVSAKDNEIAALQAKLDEQTAAVATATTAAQQFSNSLVENAFNTRVQSLVAAGIAPAVVHAVADVARNLRGTTQKLSDGTDADVADLLFSALEKTPGENRVPFSQVGATQELSDGGSDPYADIIARAAAAANNGK